MALYDEQPTASAADIQPARGLRWNGNLIAAVLLAVAVLAGGYFRYVGINWDDYTHLHPDERFLTSVATSIGFQLRDNSPEMREQRRAQSEACLAQYTETGSMSPGCTPLAFTTVAELPDYDTVAEQAARCLERYPESSGVGGYFDEQCSTMNPFNVGVGRYAYGTLPLFMAHWAGDFVSSITGDVTWSGYNGVHLVWRALSAFFDVGAIIVVFLTGRTLHGKWTGVLAALLYAGAALPIQKAHFGTVNAITAFFVILAVYFAARVQMGGRMWNFAAFGVAFAAALAGRINVLPLAGVIVLAAGIRALPLFDLRLAPGSAVDRGERTRLLLWLIGGLLLAGFAAVAAFRLFNPYAFNGPSIFGILPNARWLAELSKSQFEVSGLADGPPNWQWMGRAAYTYPFSHIVLWGMGIALGITAWVSWVWAIWRIVRGKPGALANAALVAWVLVYFAWLGRLWVMTMRYYLPLYAVLTVLAAWGLVELVKTARQHRTDGLLTRGLLLFFGSALAAVAIVSAGNTDSQTMAVIVGVVAALLLLTALLPGMILPVLRQRRAWVLTGFVAVFTLLWAVMFTSIYRQQLTRVQASRWFTESVPADFSMRIDGAPESTPLINIPMPNGPGLDENDLPGMATQYIDGVPFSVAFTAPASGTVSSVYAPHLGDPYDDSDPESVRVSISEELGRLPLAEGTLTANLVRTSHVLGGSYAIALTPPLEVVEGQRYIFTVQVAFGGPVIGAGAVVAADATDWDNPVPQKVCDLPAGLTLADNPPPGLATAQTCGGSDPWHAAVNMISLYNAYPIDNELKRDALLRGTLHADYITISSNRFYDPVARNRARWPLTNLFYDQLFNGELGFELVAVFQETFEFGPLRVSDQRLPMFSSPDWLEEFEADEAFHVYDHPVVFVFRKRADYDHNRTIALFNSAPLTDVVQAPQFRRCESAPQIPDCDATLLGVSNIPSFNAAQAATQLQLSPPLEQMQTTGGTWSARFFPDSIVNAQPILTVVFWWLAIVLFGWVTFPLLFVLFPGLGDRGYSFAKVAGLLIVGWLAWLGASLRIPVWSQEGVLLGLGLLTALSAFIAWRNRAALVQYLRTYWARLVAFEVLALLAFLAFLLVRLANPDLWHQSFGGEKPMDFAYFNAVLRSTVFPPLDPWYAGGYINYYYFGYVVVGAPVLLLGVIPSVAYNLIIPTLFSMTGMAAFGLAFNLVDSWRERSPFTMLSKRLRTRRVGNPWVAGVAAFLLAVVLGNLDTPRVFIGEGLANTGYYQQPALLQTDLIQEYTQQNGLPPSTEEMARIQQEAFDGAGDQFGSIVRGFRFVLEGRPLNLATNRWFWSPTRILSEPPVSSGGAIAEIPYFTFLYGDLHAHMIAMPLMFLAMAFVLNEVLVAGCDKRRWYMVAGALALGALVTGMFRAINTWDWPTFMLLGIIGLGFAWWLAWRKLSRRSLVDVILRVGTFIVLSMAFVAPYTTWYAAIYSSVERWRGNVMPLWAYFTIHGLFLTLLVSLLIWDTARWLRSTYVRSLRGKAPLLLALLFVFLIVLAASLFLAFVGVPAPNVAGAPPLMDPPRPVTMIAAPLLIWIALLFFRKGQSREMYFVLALAGTAVALTLGVEYIVISGDVGRQNTVFKFYIQAWLMFSVVGAAGFAWLIQNAEWWSAWLRGSFMTLVGALVIIAGLYPIMATRAKAIERMAPDMPFTLDGMDYMQYTTYFEGVLEVNPATGEDMMRVEPLPLADDWGVIRWLQANVQGTPVIMEGRSWREYLWGGRIAINTGLPSVLGWNWHQRQQRTFPLMGEQVWQRQANVNAFYATPSINTAWEMIQFYDVKYIVVSALEFAYYPQDGLLKFDRMAELGLLRVVYDVGGRSIEQLLDGELRTMYRYGGAIIYEVIPDAEYPPVGVAQGG